MPSNFDAENLFRVGHYVELLRASGITARNADTFDQDTRILLVYALALTGQLTTARDLAFRECSSTSRRVKSHAYSVLGLVDEALNDFVSAQTHHQNAIRVAQESADSERIAWAHLYAFRSAIEFHPLASVHAQLPTLRAVVARAARPECMAYLHTCVAALEGQAGRFDETVRHCDVADALLQMAPHARISCSSLISRACAAGHNCEFELAIELLQRARRFTALTGHTRALSALESNLGHYMVATGQWTRAEQSLRRVLDSATASPYEKISACDAMARLHLAAGRFDESLASFDYIEEQVRRFPKLEYSYLARNATVTKGRLLLRLGRFEELFALLRDGERHVAGTHDSYLKVALGLVSAQAEALTGNHTQAAAKLAATAEGGATSFRDLHAQYYVTCAAALKESSFGFERQLLDRAGRMWTHQGVVADRLEAATTITPARQVQRRTATSTEDNQHRIVNYLAAFVDVAYSPRLFGAELLAATSLLGCAASASITSVRQDEKINLDDGFVTLSLGNERNKKVLFRCALPTDTLKAVVLADVLTVSRAAIALHTYRLEEKRRAALWPADPIETEAGALFLAEEMQTLLATARKIASTNVPVLITGETGTGKEVLARLIHAYSNRARASFVPFNCSATPKDMLDAQLFGHRRGAFTGAVDSFQGVIRGAASGTLFLDEIGETTLDVQPKLLRFLESSEVHPIGEAQPVRVDVRVIAATNADIDGLVSQGRFREDLFYRLNIVRLHVPPLRERRVEIPTLANHYLSKAAHENGKGDLRLAEETMEYLVLYRWPGNVRQLANEMRRMAALAEAGAVLMPEHLSPEIAASRKTIPAGERVLEANEIVVRLDQPMAAAVQHVEQAQIQWAMKKSGGGLEETAAMLGISRKGLYLKRQRFGIEPPEPAAEAEVA